MRIQERRYPAGDGGVILVRKLVPSLLISRYHWRLVVDHEEIADGYAGTLSSAARQGRKALRRIHRWNRGGGA